MFLRHSHRDSIQNVQEMANLGLTNQGKEIAQIFGKNLPFNKSIRIFHSAIKRCKETAECILEGFLNIGGKGKIIGPFKPLFQVDGDREYIVDQIFNNPDKQLINRWGAAHFPPEKIEPLHIFSKNTAEQIFKMAKEDPTNHIDIYVTHDLQIMAFRYSWFGLDPCDYWVSFIGGFIISKNGNTTRVFNNGKLHEIKPPYWWGNL